MQNFGISREKEMRAVSVPYGMWVELGVQKSLTDIHYSKPWWYDLSYNLSWHTNNTKANVAFSKLLSRTKTGPGGAGGRSGVRSRHQPAPVLIGSPGRTRRRLCGWDQGARAAQDLPGGGAGGGGGGGGGAEVAAAAGPSAHWLRQKI